MHCGPLKMRLCHSAKHCDLLYSDYEMLLCNVGGFWYFVIMKVWIIELAV